MKTVIVELRNFSKLIRLANYNSEINTLLLLGKSVWETIMNSRSWFLVLWPRDKDHSYLVHMPETHVGDLKASIWMYQFLLHRPHPLFCNLLLF